MFVEVKVLAAEMEPVNILESKFDSKNFSMNIALVQSGDTF